LTAKTVAAPLLLPIPLWQRGIPELGDTPRPSAYPSNVIPTQAGIQSYIRVLRVRHGMTYRMVATGTGR